MPVFHYEFTVRAPLAAVARFHQDTRVLKRLTPPPVFAQIHYFEPLSEGSRAEFTLWFGPFPMRWVALHTQVDLLHGFTDIQVSGPLDCWQHTHRFDGLDQDNTRVSEHIVYSYPTGIRGWLGRALFSPLSLRLMFAYRAWVTRRAVENA